LSAAPYLRRAGKGVKGCQIDLLVQTERTVFVVEIKRRKEIGSGVMDEVKAKVDALGVPRGVSVRTALVYDGKLSPSIETERYFDFVVDAKAMLREV
jgi:Holliday junction resolvase-like predicted endonuclease